MRLPAASDDGPTIRALTAMRDAPTILDAIACWEDLLAATRRDDPARAEPLLADAIADATDAVTAIAAIHALSVVPEPERVTRTMTGLLAGSAPHLREHAAWALGAAPPTLVAIPELGRLVRDGSFPGTLAQLTLETWGKTAPGEVGTALLSMLAESGPEAGRTRLVETLGLVPWPQVTSRMIAIAVDPAEPPATRAAAIAALGESDSANGAVAAALAGLASGAGPLAAVARLAGDDLKAAGSRSDGLAGERLTVAQLFLHADIDGLLRHAGQGDTGGIATLLVHLGDALLEQGPIERVLTVSRGSAGDQEAARHLRRAELERPGHHYLGVPLWGPTLHASDAWPLRVAARRGLRRILRSTDVDVLHLRMADVGSWAAASVAGELGIPTVLTLAPDPHALIAAQEAEGSLSRATFGEADRAAHLIFRVRLLRALADRAARLVVFPRPQLERDLRDLLGLELSSHPDGIAVVPEGIDLRPPDRALREVPDGPGRTGRSEATREALDEMDRLLETLAPERRGLPLVITVGRLHPVKGMATLVKAWAGDPGLNARCNLLVVGGDLDTPSDEEAAQLALIDAAIPRDEAPARGLLLAGHRPNATVATWLAAVRFGRPGGCRPLGVYVSASLKEEFGIAILEAMATGLVVVAPRVGGPATYVEDGVSGVLADTASPEDLCRAVTQALDLAGRSDADVRAQHAIALVRDRFSIDTMAAALAGLYEEVASGNRTAPGGPVRKVLR